MYAYTSLRFGSQDPEPRYDGRVCVSGRILELQPFPPVYPGNRQTRLYQPQDAGLRGMPNFRILTAAAA